MLVSGLHMASLSLSEEELKVNDKMMVPSKRDRDEKIQQIRTGFINRLHLNRPWAYGLGFCEVLNFTNAIVQIYVTDWFLGGAFLGLGQAVTEPLTNDKMDPLDVVFPKVKTRSRYKSCNLLNGVPRVEHSWNRKRSLALIRIWIRIMAYP